MVQPPIPNDEGISDLEFAARVGIVRAQLEDAYWETSRLALGNAGDYVLLAIDALPFGVVRDRDHSKSRAFSATKQSGDKDRM